MNTNIKLTSFEPFGKYKYNPTISVMSAVQKYFQNSTEIKLSTQILQCKYSTIREEVYDIYKDDPDIIISLGLRANTSYLNLESVAQNEYSSTTPDNDGVVLNGSEIISSSDNLNNTLDIQQLKILSEKYVDTVVSYDAGKFMCNANFFWNQYKINTNNLYTKYLFIHIPFTDIYFELEPEITNNKLPILKENNIVESIISIIKKLSNIKEK